MKPIIKINAQILSKGLWYWETPQKQRSSCWTRLAYRQQSLITAKSIVYESSFANGKRRSACFNIIRT